MNDTEIDEFEAQQREANQERIDARRIVNGKTYNTATSELIAARVWDEPDSNRDGAVQLFRTRDGRFFEASRQTRSWRNRDTGRQEKRETVEVTPVDDENAPDWAERNKADIIRDVFSLLDEDAPAGQATLLLRMSASEKEAFRQFAEKRSQSMNECVLNLAKVGLANNGRVRL